MVRANIKYLKKNILSFSSSNNATVALSYQQEDIKKIIPHRKPFLFLERLTQLNLTDNIIEGESYINPNNEVFLGHFPNKPVYPGVLQIEMMGQLGLCLLYFIKHNVTQIESGLIPVSGLFTKVHHTAFLSPVYPADKIQIRVKLLEHDEWLGTMVGQIIKNNTICSFSILEVYFDE